LRPKVYPSFGVQRSHVFSQCSLGTALVLSVKGLTIVFYCEIRCCYPGENIKLYLYSW